MGGAPPLGGAPPGPAPGRFAGRGPPVALKKEFKKESSIVKEEREEKEEKKRARKKLASSKGKSNVLEMAHATSKLDAYDEDDEDDYDGGAAVDAAEKMISSAARDSLDAYDEADSGALLSMTQRLDDARLTASSSATTTTAVSAASATTSSYYHVAYTDADLLPYQQADVRRRKQRRVAGGDAAEEERDDSFDELSEARTTVSPLQPLDLRSSIDFGGIDTRRASATGMSSPPTSPLSQSDVRASAVGSSQYELPTGEDENRSQSAYSEPSLRDALMSTPTYTDPEAKSDQSATSQYREYGYEASSSEIDATVLRAGAKRARAASSAASSVDNFSLMVEDESTPVDEDSHDRDWNHEFQALWDETLAENRSTTLQEMYVTRAKIGTLAREFTDSATRIAKVLISEVFLPPTQKSIRPIDVGGVGGGLKYVHGGVFFKFVVDEFGLYGGNEFAAKTAKHELRGLQLFMNLTLEQRVPPQMHFPLTAVIDWRGFRVLASAVLPIARDSLVYGSADAGQTVQADPAIAPWMEAAGRLLNLKVHPVMTRDQSTVQQMATCADIEVHRVDSRFYMLDTHRVMPPQLPDGRKGAFLYNLFRPSFVERYPVPLCSDGFSVFGRGDATSSKHLAAHNRELREATELLLTERVEEVAARCRERWPTSDTFVDPRLFVPMLHRGGINVRHLGALRGALIDLDCEHMADECLREMIARTLKALVRRQWRQLRTHIGDRDYVALACLSVELLFASDAASVAATRAFWCSSVQGIKAELSVRFGTRALTVRERHADFSLALVCDGRVIARLCALLGIELTSAATARLLEPRSACTVSIADVRQVAPRATRLYLVAFHDAYSVWASEDSKSLVGSARLAHLDVCIERWFEVLNSSPNDVRAISNLAMAYKLRALHVLESLDVAQRAEVADAAFAPVHWLHQDAIEQVDDADTRYNAGVAFREHALHVTGERRDDLLSRAALQFEAALHVRLDDHACMVALANTCVQQALRYRFGGNPQAMQEKLLRTRNVIRALQLLGPSDEVVRLSNVVGQLESSVGLQGEQLRDWWTSARAVLQQAPSSVGGRVFTLSRDNAVVQRGSVVRHPSNAVFPSSDQMQSLP
jgi:hypothetical protein